MPSLREKFESLIRYSLPKCIQLHVMDGTSLFKVVNNKEFVIYLIHEDLYYTATIPYSIYYRLEIDSQVVYNYIRNQINLFLCHILLGK